MKKLENLKEFYFGYDLENVLEVMGYVKEKFKEEDYRMWYGYGDDVINMLEVFSEEMVKDKGLLKLISVCDGGGYYVEEEEE